MGVGAEDELAAQPAQMAQQRHSRIGLRPIAPADRSGVQFKGHGLFYQMLHDLHGPPQVPGRRLVKGGQPLVELGHQIEVPDPVAPGLLGQVGHQVVVGVGVPVPVPAELLLHRLAALLRALIHRVEPPIQQQAVDRTDPIVQPLRALAVAVQLHAYEEVQFSPVPLFQRAGGLQVDRNLIPREAEVLLPLAPAVAGEAQPGQSAGAGRLRHLLQRVPPVIQGGVGVEISQYRGHPSPSVQSEAIFSCFTLWSITWRLASSASTSSREMPASTIRTIT